MRSTCFLTDEWIAPEAFSRIAQDREALEHLIRCPVCREELQAYAAFLSDAAPGRPLSAEEKLALLAELDSSPNGVNFGWLNLKLVLNPAPVILAAASGQNADQQLSHAAAISGYLYFHAACPKISRAYWSARIAIPSSPTEETLLRIHLTDGANAPLAGGIFELCGIRIPIKNGRAFLKLGELRTHLDQPVAAWEINGVRQEGVPAFFEDNEV